MDEHLEAEEVVHLVGEGVQVSVDAAKDVKLRTAGRERRGYI